MVFSQKQREDAIRKELLAVKRKELKLERSAQKARTASWKTEMESRIPAKVYAGLESAFCKAFEVLFKQGRTVVEKGYNKEIIQADHAIRDLAVQLKGSRRELRQMHRSAKRADYRNLAVTAVEGIGLGAVGIGMPDVLLFLGNLLKGIYETALNFGFEYESRQEQFFILKLMQTALSRGDDWIRGDREVEEMLSGACINVTDEDFDLQVKDTASVFAMDMLLLKFIQGIPVVGIVGGVANPVYYGRVMEYVQLKYRKRYLLKQKISAASD